MDKRLDLGKSVQALCTDHPELLGILRGLGFTDITRPGMLETAGRFMTLPRGARMKKLDLAAVIAALENEGYTIEGSD